MTPTADIIKAAYAYLNETPPFVDWNLPDADDVEFEVWDNKFPHAGCHCPNRKWKNHALGLSSRSHHHTNSIIMALAHEMVHLHLHQIGYRGWKSHGRAFKKIASEVCAAHGFDPGQF